MVKLELKVSLASNYFKRIAFPKGWIFICFELRLMLNIGLMEQTASNCLCSLVFFYPKAKPLFHIYFFGLLP